MMKHYIICILFCIYYFQSLSIAVVAETDKLSSESDDLDLDDDFEAGGRSDSLQMSEHNEDDSAKTDDSDKSETLKHKIPYEVPSKVGLEFAETFDNDVFSRWIKSEDSKFDGEWKVTARTNEAFYNDLGLKITSANKFHGIATKFADNALSSNYKKHTIISYEVKGEEGWVCGGAYMKLFNTNTLKSKSNLGSFNNETPYIVMFGPDVCGSTNRVHVILKFENPSNKKWTEYHLKDPPAVPIDRKTHLYTLHLMPDNKYELLVDNKITNQGSMFDDFVPPFANEKMITDPNDVKPSDWVDEKMIFDTNAKKPDDWDEDQPITIEDPNASKPDDWDEDLEPIIPDANAEKPDTWDSEVSGEWYPPLVENPACKGLSGCGHWEKPMISNPKYKGKWVAPLIENPNYKGPWSAKKIPNPHYHKVENPHNLPDIDAIGFELWTVHKGVILDNIAVSRDMAAVKKFIQATWEKRSSIEKKQNDDVKSENIQEAVKEKIQDTLSWVELAKYQIGFYFQQYPIACFSTIAMVFLSTMYFIISMFQQPATPSAPTEAKTTQESKKSKNLKGATQETDKKQINATTEEEIKDKEENVTTRKRAAAAAPSKQDT